MQAAARRDRYSRTPQTAFQGRLGERSIAILHALNDFEFLRSDWLYALCGSGSLRGFKNRLTYLFHETGLIERPIQQTHALSARYRPSVYRLSAPGRLWLLDNGYTLRNPVLTEGPFAHNLLAAQVQAGIKLGADRTPGLRFIFRDEILHRAPAQTKAVERPFALPVTIVERTHGASNPFSTKYLADAWFGIEHSRSDGTKSYRFFCLEVNHAAHLRTRDLKSPSHLRKLLSLRALREQRAFSVHLGISAPVIALFVQTTERMTTESMALLSDLTGGAGDSLVAFKTLPTFQQESAPLPLGAVFRGPWRRVGHPEFFVGS